jgi:L-alanine-DL-glutamate epimerase-like enolase superfamily enzyme
MKITKVEVFPLAARTREPISGHLPYEDSYGSKIRAGYYATFVKITTDEGIVGWGESISREVPQASALIVERLLSPLLLGQDPLDIEVLYEKMLHTLRTRGHTQGYFIEAISGVDCALWDIAGKCLELPVHKLLGGAHSKKIKAYASSILFGKTEDMVKAASTLRERGFDQIKVKVGRGEEDILAVKGIRDALGYADFEIMVDANSAFNVASAIRWGRKFEKYECSWFEEPVPPDDLSGYVRLTRDLDIPICGSEGLFGRYNFRDFIVSGAVDIIQPDIARVGGISEIRKIISMAAAFDLPVTLHIGLSGAGCRAASLQVAPTIPRELFLSYETYFLHNPLHTDIIKAPLEEFKDGYLKVPTGPGLSLQIDEQRMLTFVAK